MEVIEKLLGSVTVEEFLNGLLLSTSDNSLGTAWEKCVTCPHCLFAKQCATLGEAMEAQGKNPTCGQIVDLLLGDLTPESSRIQNV